MLEDGLEWLLLVSLQDERSCGKVGVERHQRGRGQVMSDERRIALVCGGPDENAASGEYSGISERVQDTSKLLAWSRQPTRTKHPNGPPPLGGALRLLFDGERLGRGSLVISASQEKVDPAFADRSLRINIFDSLDGAPVDGARTKNSGVNLLGQIRVDRLEGQGDRRERHRRVQTE